MVACTNVCMRRLAQGCWAAQMQYWRFLANARVTVEKLIDGWSGRTQVAAAGRHVLAIQDTSELRFATTPENRRGLGKVKKGNSHGVLMHAMKGDGDDAGNASREVQPVNCSGAGLTSRRVGREFP